jgi:hypothetical protein
MDATMSPVTTITDTEATELREEAGTVMVSAKSYIVFTAREYGGRTNLVGSFEDETRLKSNAPFLRASQLYEMPVYDTVPPQSTK